MMRVKLPCLNTCRCLANLGKRILNLAFLKSQTWYSSMVIIHVEDSVIFPSCKTQGQWRQVNGCSQNRTKWRKSDKHIPIELDPRAKGIREREQAHEEDTHGGIHRESSRKCNKPAWMRDYVTWIGARIPPIVSYEFVLLFIFSVCAARTRGEDIRVVKSDL